MPRPKSPCGTYPAYQRHLREKTPVDPACRRAQQKHDAARGRGWRAGDAERRVVRSVVELEVDSFEKRESEAQARFLEVSEKLRAVVDGGNLHSVIDLMQELDGLLDVWIFAADELDASNDFPDHPADLRKDLIAAWLELACDAEAGADEISEELRSRLLARRDGVEGANGHGEQIVEERPGK